MKFFGFQWHITNYCNLRCFHCYQDDFTHAQELKFDELIEIPKKIATTLKGYHIGINVTGGEPLLYPNIYPLLSLFESIDNIRFVNIITNGLLLDIKTIKRLNGFEKLKEIKISLEGGDVETNDRIRGKGVFERVIKNIESIRNISKSELILMFTLGSYNYKNLEKMIQLAQTLKIDGVIIERFVPWGKGILLKDDFLKKDEWYGVISRIIKFTNIDYEPLELLPYKAFHIGFKNSLELKGALCNLGDESMALMPNGNVYPCRRFPSKIGNIVQDDFKEILLRLKILKENLIANLKGKCAGCKIDGCWGCRAIAYALSKDFYAEDPQCFL